jgi:hypothetical protein
MKKAALIALCAVLFLSLYSCKVDDMLVPPTINYFTVTPDRAFIGGTLQLSWDVKDADTVSINFGVGDVELSGTRSIILNTQGEFQIVLTAESAGGIREAQVEVRAYDVSWTYSLSESDTFGNSIIQIEDADDEGYVVVGKTTPSGGYSDFILFKLDLSGNLVWKNAYGGQYDDEGGAVRRAHDGGYIIAGTTTSFGAGQEDIYVIKTDALGNEVWSKTYGGWTRDVAYDIQPTADQGYVIAGTTHSFGEVLGDAYLIKINQNGNQQWGTIFGGINVEEGIAVQESTDLGYLLLGSTKTFGAGAWDVFLAKIGIAVDRLWYNTFGGEADDKGMAVQRVLSEGTLEVGNLIVGTTNSFGEDSENIFVIKTDNEGNTIWSYAYESGGEDEGNSAFQAPDDSFMILGSTIPPGNTLRDIYLLWVDPEGDINWDKILQSEGDEWGNSIIKTEDGGFIIVGGIRDDEESPSSAYVIKID